MPETAPTTQVDPHELPSSLRDAGLTNWVREPLDDAVDRRRRLILPAATATMGTPAHELRQTLLAEARTSDSLIMMGDNPALPTMPDRPTLADFFRLRFDTTGKRHLLQSARLATENGMDEKVIIACLLHDIAFVGLMSSNHGYWGAQLVAPYVDEEVAWAIQKHEPLRYFPDESVGYKYPDTYLNYFGPDFSPPEHVRRDAEEARKHRWYMTSRLVTTNDLYSHDPNVVIEFEEFEDLVGRHFKQPKEGLGFDGSPSAHMWRTIIWPNNFL